ncbi:DUF3108 domain-containing protein [Noviherbaspirillum sp. ST9]|uniref:DUF3108 domain-containing protein n=1 Tax=Noviherbaspirillum sp. ST9 TaxID=3401606 RepID=UPI003B588BAC
MVRTPPPAHSPPSVPKQSVRRILLPAALLASLLWHLFLFNWASGRIALPAIHEEKPELVATELLPPPVAAPKTPPPVAAKPKRKPKPRPAAPPPVAEAVAMGQATAEPVPPPLEEAPVETVEPPAPVEPQQAAETTGTYKFALPPSAELNYEVRAFREGQQWHGSGVFHWNADAASYVITGEASITVLFKITVLNFRSEGAINASGIAPTLYSEKPWRKAMTNTHFQHENKTISFSASQAVYPYNGGEQDRASIMWQLAGIGRGDPGQFIPGTAFDIMVAGARNAETWRIDVVGQEDIDTPFGKIAAWHVVRAPKPGSYDQKIDIWLAPGHEWYPARVLFTYAKGDYLDMLLTELKPPASVHSSSGNE